MQVSDENNRKCHFFQTQYVKNMIEQINARNEDQGIKVD